MRNACETDLVSLRFALKRKIFFCETGAPYLEAVFPPLQPCLPPPPVPGLPLLANWAFSIPAKGAGAGVAMAGGGGIRRERDSLAVPPRGSNITLNQLPVARHSWCHSRMWETSGPENRWGGVEHGEGVAGRQQFGRLPLEALHPPSCCPSPYFTPLEGKRGRGRLVTSRESQGGNSSPDECWLRILLIMLRSWVQFPFGQFCF